MIRTIYSTSDLKDLTNIEILRHSFLHVPDLFTYHIEYTDILMLGTVNYPHWRCKAHHGKFRTGYCFGSTLDEAKENAKKELATKWFNQSNPIHETQYERVMWM